MQKEDFDESSSSDSDSSEVEERHSAILE